MTDLKHISNTTFYGNIGFYIGGSFGARGNNFLGGLQLDATVLFPVDVGFGLSYSPLFNSREDKSNVNASNEITGQYTLFSPSVAFKLFQSCDNRVSCPLGVLKAGPWLGTYKYDQLSTRVESSFVYGGVIDFDFVMAFVNNDKFTPGVSLLSAGIGILNVDSGQGEGVDFTVHINLNAGLIVGAILSGLKIEVFK